MKFLHLDNLCRLSREIQFSKIFHVYFFSFSVKKDKNLLVILNITDMNHEVGVFFELSLVKIEVQFKVDSVIYNSYSTLYLDMTPL